MQKYRADEFEKQADGAKLWYTNWIGGPTISKIENCRLPTLAGSMRRTVYVTGEANTYFSTPAVCKIGGRKVTGYVTSDDEGLTVFRHCYY